MASTYFDQGRFQEAEKLYREVFDTRRRTLGADHPDTLAAMDGYATTLATENKLTDSKRYCARR